VAGSSRTDAARRVVELTGLGIAATYFLDPTHGAERRRTAWRWLAGGRTAPVAAPAAVEQPAVVEVALPAPPEPPEELVLLSSDRLPAAAPPREAVDWPSWGWALVLTITVCALAAFAAVGLGIWAIEHRDSTTTVRTITRPDVGAAAVLADPTARRIIGTANPGQLLLRVDPDGAVLAVAGLPPQTTYRVWVTAAGTTTAAGSFTGPRAILTLKPIGSGSRVTITRPGGSRIATLAVP
jgi:hypothetical protein